jgi:hypothetical protein
LVLAGFDGDAWSAVLRLSACGLLVIGRRDSALGLVFERGVAGTPGVCDLVVGRG